MVKGVHLDYTVPEQLNMASYFLEENLLRGRASKAAIYYQDNVYTYDDLCRLTNRVGNVMRGLGVEPENRVLLILQDSPEWLASWFGAIKIGGVGTHAYTYLRASDYSDFIELVRPKVVVVDASTLDRVREGARGLRYPKAILFSGDSPPHLEEREYHLQSLLRTAAEELDAEPTHRDDIALWNFSGGTTGKPKAVPHTHRDAVVAFESFQAIFHYTADDIVLRVPKLFFHYSRDLGMHFPLRAGAALVLFRERTTVELIFDLVRRYRPTVLINVPTMMREMIQTPLVDRTDLSSVRLCMSSGELLSAQLYEEWVKTFGGEVANRFGSAESFMGYICNEPGSAVPGSSGTVTPMSEVKLVDQNGLEVPRGEAGVMRARCPAGGLYYVRDPEKSKTTFVGNGWIDTGDVFVQDDKDYFWYRGRVDEMVKVSGVWVSPLEIERCLEKHPSVRECAVLGLEDKDRLITTKAFVTLQPEVKASKTTVEELKEFCKKALAPYKYPRVIEFLGELPKTGQGKIDKRQLRERDL
jgi:benzoate-CoA ligase family protein